jgi:hypothetical protein
MHFCIRDPNPTRAEPCFSAGFVFSPVGAPKTQKKPETRKKPEKTQNPKETKKPERNPKKPERNPFTKPDGHPNLTRNPTGSGSGAKFHPRVRVSNST